jgi:hypothetical protein
MFVGDKLYIIGYTKDGEIDGSRKAEQVQTGVCRASV